VIPEASGRPSIPDHDLRALRILVLNWQDLENPHSGGAEIHLHETFGRLARRGHEVVVLVSGWPGAAPRAEADGLEIHRTGGRYTYSLAAPRYYRRHLSHRDFDVVVEDLNKVPVFARYWTGAPVVPLVHHLFGSTAFQEASVPVATATWLLERPLPRVYGGATGVAVSESTRTDLARRGFDPSGFQVIPNGIDLEAFTPGPEGARYDEPSLLYLGRLKRYKGVELILQALGRLREHHPDQPVRFRIAGRGDHEDALRDMVARLGLSDRVEFLGFVSEEDKLQLFRRSWVHVLTSPNEGWGIANIEAAACGTPTVASDAPGLRESVRDGETGLLVPHGDVPALASALRALLGDRPRVDALGREARRFAEGFSWDASALRMEELLRRVVGASGGD